MLEGLIKVGAVAQLADHGDGILQQNKRKKYVVLMHMNSLLLWVFVLSDNTATAAAKGKAVCVYLFMHMVAPCLTLVSG